MTPGLWSIVLAGGAGRRLASLTGGVPKQFWRPRGGASLLETTLARLAPLSDSRRTVVVVDQLHRPHVESERISQGAALLFQPSDRGTAAGLLLALMPVLATEPDAIVLVTPADHGIRDEARFRRGVIEAIQHVRDHGDVVLFGAAATSANDDYGWIVPRMGSNVDGFRPVCEFVEKPPVSEADRLLECGGVWNTMVVVARASDLQALFRKHLNALARVFDHALSLAPQEREEFLAGVYPTLSSWDLSRDLLTPARELMVYTWPKAIGWSDLGTPERLQGWFRRPAPVHSLHTVDAA